MQVMGPSLRTEPATPTDPCGINATPHFAFLSFHIAQSPSIISKAHQSKRTAAGVPCPTRRLRLPTHNTPFVTQTDFPSSVTPMTRPRPSHSVRAIVESAVPHIRVEAISIIPTKRLLRSFEVKLADERTLLLNLAPPSSRLLRSEQWLLQSEALVVGWLLEDVRQDPDKSSPFLDEKSTGKYPQGESPPRRWTGRLRLDASSLTRDRLVDYLPTLIQHSPASTEAGTAFSLLEPTPGDSISSLGEPLNRAEQKTVNFQKGRLMRRIANVVSPNRRFGSPITVLGSPQAPEDTHRAPRETKLDVDGANSWRKTFHLLLEGILRDGEDLAVTMSYELVRSTFNKFSHLLDAVTTPRLVVYDADEDDVVLVSRTPRAPQKQEQQEQQDPEALLRSLKVEPEPDDSPTSPAGEHLDEDGAADIQITGLRDWSNCIFGDPLFATVFAHPNEEFERGFRQRPYEADIIKKEESGDDNDEERKQEEADIIEDPDNAPTRILLYECYHATVSIVRQFYRPDADSSQREIAARRRLVAALAKLEHVSASEPAIKRPRRLSRDEWPVKRPRGDTPK